jgi:hypothetical protein
MAIASRLLNDGSNEPPSLRVYLNLHTLADLGSDNAWGGKEGVLPSRNLLDDGFEGVQLIDDDPAPADHELPYCGMGRINTPQDADPVVARHAGRGDLCLTVHAGWGLEGDEEAFRIVDAILTASDRHGLPVFVETHRATITQDLWRTVQIAGKFPELRFNGDFSHYYCGQELVYGNWDEKVAFMEPILERTGFLHGRIASPGCMQVPIGPDPASRPLQAHGRADYLAHFRELWIRAMTGFLRHAVSGDVLIFAPELLSGNSYYARLFPDGSGQMVEESDRYAQALLLNGLARSCFAEAMRLAPSSSEQIQ